MEKPRKTLRSLSGIIKDRASLAKSSLSFNPRSTAVIKATTHNATSAPKDYRIAALLSYGLERQFAAAECIGSLIDRLHKTGNTFVALKCLYVAHTILSQGSLTLRDYLSTFPSNGGHNFLNLSTFRDNCNSETTEFSLWVRWYSGFLEQTMIAARVLGYYLYPPPETLANETLINLRWKKMRQYSTSFDLAREIETLVSLILVICGAPDSVHLQKNDLIYEIVRSVGEDYRIIRHEIRLRLVELIERLESMSSSELARLSGVLEQFEDCKGKLFVLFRNKASNDGLWEEIIEAKHKSKWVKMRRTNPFLALSWTSS